MVIDWDDPYLVIGDHSPTTQHHNDQDLPHHQSSELDRLVRNVRYLPDLTLNHLKAQGKLQVLPDGEALELLESIRTQYLCLSQWLDFYLLDRAELESELFHTYKNCYKTYAEENAAFFRLIQELCPRSDELQELNFSAARLWFTVLTSNCWRELAETGIAGPAEESGKTELIKQGRQAIKAFKRLARGKDSISDISSDEEDTSVIKHHNLEAFILLVATEVASYDSYFRKHHLKPYWDVRTRYWNEIEADDQFQVMFVGIDGKSFTGGFGKKNPKGFVPKRPRGRPPKGHIVKSC